jgi:hypothetical protein
MELDELSKLEAWQIADYSSHLDQLAVFAQ